MRSVLGVFDMMEALHRGGVPARFDGLRRIVVIAVNSRAAPPTPWDEDERPPGTVSQLIQASGVRIDHYSFEAMELLKDKQDRWQAARRLRQSAAFAGNTDPTIAELLRAPNVTIFPIDVSFAALTGRAEVDYLNALPTNWRLPGEAVVRLRAAAATLIRDSPEFPRLLEDVGARIVPEPAAGNAGTLPM